MAKPKAVTSKKSKTFSGWGVVPDIHMPASMFVGDETDTLVYRKWTRAEAKKASASADAEEKEVRKVPPPTVTIVHVSDSHLKHELYDCHIPAGDILIHSGDFGKRSKPLRSGEFPPEIAEFDKWLASHSDDFAHRIVIAGNHEICFNGCTVADIQAALPHCTYLQDSGTSVFGLKVWGTPWTNSSRMAFCKKRGDSKEVWKAIPTDTDIVVTHSPPRGIFDLAWSSRYDFTEPCELCGKIHRSFKHWGNADLLSEIQTRIEPALHLFGHVHDEVGFKTIGETTFINSALDIADTPHRVRIVFDM